MSCPEAAASGEIIRSRHNARLKVLRQLLLRPAPVGNGLIAIEGEHLLREAVRSGLRVVTMFLREERQQLFGPSQKGSDAIRAQETIVVAADAFNHACATDSPQGVAAIVEIRQTSLEAVIHAPAPLIAILAALQDPGNVGTILRTAEAFGVTGVLLTPGTANPWNQKALRASAGSIFRVPVFQLERISQLTLLQQHGVKIYACAARGGLAVEDAAWGDAAAFAIGNEGAGIPADVLAFCDATIHIPMPGPVESLNAAMAASIVCYQASRQRAAASIGSKP